ncbi:MAG: D-alanine--D-alanine ligase [Armatimonadota bacterium]|nr:D-alanine--D-alanine ligase [Armatimonadota bacterium]
MVRGGKKLKVAVLMGGLSSERDVSLSSGKQILDALDSSKYEVIGIDAGAISARIQVPVSESQKHPETVMSGKDLATGAYKLLPLDCLLNSQIRPDVAVVALHGRYGEDGTIQGMLELLDIPYTGSGVLASALAMDKAMAKKVMAADGIPVPRSIDFVCTGSDWDRDWVASRAAELGYPVIVKPSRQGSTIGMTKVTEPECLDEAVERALKYDNRILVEEFVEGTELTVAVLGNDSPIALPVVEIVPAKGFYDYEAKYTPGATEEIVPARIPDAVAREAQRLATTAHASLGCSGVSRTDIIYAPQGRTNNLLPSGGALYVLEVNTVPGMTPTSLLPRAAEAAGISFSRLLDMLIEFALEDGRR